MSASLTPASELAASPEGAADAAEASAVSGEPTQIAGRYYVCELLGRGGTAAVYRVLDRQTATYLALKMLSQRADERRWRRAVARFQREYHALTQLAHPRVVQVFDYGIWNEQPYYTMELLDGGDLRSQSPLPYRDVCNIAYEACSVLSLLHSRRLVHRDLTPSNIRRTADGRAKLLDFGLVSRMGVSGLAAGTPAYAAPELVQGMMVDGRSDLFSLGATMYLALTGRSAFPVRGFSQIQDQWRSVPVAPQRLRPEIPAALSELVQELLRIDVGSRPRSAAEVMERLLPFLATTPAVELEVARSYLVSPQLVGRDEHLLLFRRRLLSSQRANGGGFLVSGHRGVGRTRMLDAFVLEAKLSGAVALRGGHADSAAAPFGLAIAFARQLHQAMPWLLPTLSEGDAELYAPLLGLQGAGDELEGLEGGSWSHARSAVDGELSRVQQALLAYVLAATRERVVALAVDDLETIQGPGMALLAALSFEAARHRLVFAFALADDGPTAAPAATQLIREHAELVSLSSLNIEQVSALLRSMFGEIPGLQHLCRTIYPVCDGLPRECVELSQHLVEQDLAHYADGSWSLPTELSIADLATALETRLDRQLSRLSELSRSLLLTLSLDVAGQMDREGLLALHALREPMELELSLYELDSRGLLTASAGVYSLSHRAHVPGLLAAVDDEALRSCHAALSELHRKRKRASIVIAYHLLAAGAEREGVDLLSAAAADGKARVRFVAESVAAVGAERTATTLRWAVQVAEELELPVVHQQRLWIVMAAMAAQGEDPDYFYAVAPRWLHQLKLDSGYDEYLQLSPDLPSSERLQQALSLANNRYIELADEHSAVPPSEAIRQLTSFAALAIAVSGRTLDIGLRATLVELLAPFAPLSPVLALIYDDARGSFLLSCGKRWSARNIFVEVLSRLEPLDQDALLIVDALRSSVRLALATIDVSLGLYSSYVQYQERLHPEEPSLVANSFYTMKVSALHHGDWGIAERYRQQAELWALQSGARAMFSSLEQELEAHILARDLTGVRQLRPRLFDNAQVYPRWRIVAAVAEAWYLRLREQPREAFAVLDRAEAQQRSLDERSPWLVQACILRVALHTQLGQLELAIALAEPMLADCRKQERYHLARLLSCELSLAYAGVGRRAQARALMAQVLAEQDALGVHGLLSGYSHEVCARIAILDRDVNAFNDHAASAATYYNWSGQSGLAPLYECLLDDARDAGLLGGQPPPHSTVPSVDAAASGRVAAALCPCTDEKQRAEQALMLLCERTPPRMGYLILNGEQGLFMAAESASEPTAEAALEFAQAYVEAQLEEQEQAITVSVTLDSPDKAFEDEAGRCFEVQALLLTEQTGQALVGIALLSDLSLNERDQVQRLAQAIALKLHQEADVVPLFSS